MKTKDVGLRIRVERELRDGFVEACRAEDRPAAQVLREFMRSYVSKIHAPAPVDPAIDEPSSRAENRNEHRSTASMGASKPKARHA
ncbi:MAG: hypothetical protein EOQ92_22955 [Mesorhizobium sp.]|nr:MAG: hypothetical protein EOQ92_22955 [Mesorhizobium sp.]RWK93395.1 MAG: hypothetical protein EOR53_23600 [Mesorhizobium sp.]TJW41506.1 MAG: hypothetical protein E5X59_24100 [Mesorhizobium sp.]